MTKYKSVYIVLLIFLIIVNTNSFWEHYIINFEFGVFILLALYFIVLGILLIWHIVAAIGEGYKNKQRLLLTITIASVMIFTWIYPNGIINKETTISAPILTAQCEGAANCMTTLVLRENNTFDETNICFGAEQTTGTYYTKGDTIYFNYPDNTGRQSEVFEYALVFKEVTNSKVNSDILVRYKNHQDSIGTSLWITKNDLIH